MQRRNFLKALGIIAVAPSVVVAKDNNFIDDDAWKKKIKKAFIQYPGSMINGKSWREEMLESWEGEEAPFFKMVREGKIKIIKTNVGVIRALEHPIFTRSKT